MDTANLLYKPMKNSLDMLDSACEAIKKASPIPAKHHSDLPFAVRDLSRLLTQERGDLAQSYWSAPRFLAAYMRFFLPWNLYRLSWLLPKLHIPLRAGQRVLDFGSGPLTLPLALWCFRPDLRSIPLHFTCFDVASKPMETGLMVLQHLAGEKLSWKIELSRTPIDRALQNTREQADLIMAGNMLNELSASKNSNLEERLSNLMVAMRKKLTPTGKILLVEPGNRLGGKLIALARKGAIQNELNPLAPCTHAGPCPALQDHESIGQHYSGWCHFIYPAAGVPAELLNLGERARLEKDTLAISCLLLQKEKPAHQASLQDMDSLPDSLDELDMLYEEIMAEDKALAKKVSSRPTLKNIHEKDIAKHPDMVSGNHVTVRIISDLIRLPDQMEAARYACGEAGLMLVHDAVHLPSGGAAEVIAEHTILPNGQQGYARDVKSGAILAHKTEDKRSKTAAVKKPTRDNSESPQKRGKPAARRPAPKLVAETHGANRSATTPTRKDKKTQTKDPGVKKTPMNKPTKRQKP